MRLVKVRYDGGQELLGAYWNSLRSGGVVLPSADGLVEGEAVELEVAIRSMKKTFRIGGSVSYLADDGRAFVAFGGDERHEALLNAAWSDGFDVPERRHHRFELRREVQYAIAGAPRRATMTNLSRGGCSIEIDERLPVGAHLYLMGFGLATVRWAAGAGHVVGLQFETLLDATPIPSPQAR